MIQRYSRPEMRAIWTDENKLRIWLQIELLASEALARAKIVPQADHVRLKKGACESASQREPQNTQLRGHRILSRRCRIIAQFCWQLA
jgi:adenylosuccinate lyase